MSFIEMDEVVEKLTPAPELPEGYSTEERSGDTLLLRDYSLVAYISLGRVVTSARKRDWPALIAFLQEHGE